MKIPSIGDGTRGAERELEILPDTMVTVAVEVKERKLPLKIHLQYRRKGGEG